MNDTPPPNPPLSGIAKILGKDFELPLLNWIFAAFIAFGFIAIATFAETWAKTAVCFLWALACLAVGAFVGLLFGIPRMRQRNGPNQDGRTSEVKAAYEPLINNNLIEVSDWLTKIIVGLGLVELGKLPEHLKRAASPLVACLGHDCALAVAVGIILCFVVTGFLGGYINARTFITTLIVGAEKRLLQENMDLREKVDQTQSEKQALEAVASDQQKVVQIIAGKVVPTDDSAPGQAVDAGLAAMATEYTEIKHPEHQARVALKNGVTSRMLNYILEKKIPKGSLARWVEANPNDGLIVALAAYIGAVPQNGDMQKLLAVASKAQRLHIQYRVSLAFRQLQQNGIGTPDEWKKASSILNEYVRNARNKNDKPVESVALEVIGSIGRMLGPLN